MGKTIITCAVTGGGDTVERNPSVPVTPTDVAQSALEAARAGAAIVHIHVRDPDTGRQSMRIDLYREVVDRIRSSATDVVINLTTGPGGVFIPGDENPLIGGPGSTLTLPAARVAHVVELRPEICSLDCGSMNFYERPYIAAPSHLRAMARAITEAGVKAELEVFDAGHLRFARQLIDEQLIPSPAFFQIVLGVPWNAPASAEALLFLRGLLPADAIWAAFAISHGAFSMAAQSFLLGGHVRVGLEDTLHLGRGVLARSNAVLVERVRTIVESLGGEVATPGDARAILGVEKRG